MRRYFFVFMLAILLVACNGFPVNNAFSNGIIKSANDQREYRFLELSNQLRVLLISDNKAKHAAASLDVHVGSRHDPIHRQGLAHFLEHMLFLGTQKYPLANSYQQFVSQHGGSYNAYTSFEHTNYYFDVGNAHLDATLDRFADFFVQPLFDNGYIEREVNAVESEYRSRISDESRRIVDATRQVVNPRHPYKKFSVGSLDTLKLAGLQKDLLSFYQQYYSSNRMALAVIGDYTLDQLEDMVRSRFLAVENKNSITQPITEPIFYALPKILAVKTNKPVRRLSLSFPLPDLSENFQSKPLQYIGNILGDEGKGSLLSALKNKGLAESLSAGMGLNYKGGSLFQVSIGLTDIGLQKTDAIIELVFATLKKIQVELDTQPDSARNRFDEQQRLSALGFRFYEQPPERNMVIAMTASLHYYPWQSVIAGAYDYSKYDTKLISQNVARLNADNLLVTVAADQLPTMLAVNKKTQWYDVEYSSQAVPQQWVDKWKSTELADAAGLISLSGKNLFIPDDFALYEAEYAGNAEGLTKPNDIPFLASDKLGSRLWLKTDDEFEVPKAAFYVALLSDYQNQSVKKKTLAALYSMAVADQLNEYIYPAYLAGMQVAFYPHLRGFSLKVEGFNDGLQPLLSSVVPMLNNITINEYRFAELQKILQRRWQAAMQSAPHTQLGALLSTKLIDNNLQYSELLKALEGLSLVDLKGFVEQFWPTVYVEMLAHGNLKQIMAKKMQALVLDLPNCQCVYRAEHYDVGEQQLSGAWRETLELEHNDAAVIWYFQAPDDALKSVVSTMLTASILHPEFYSALRTEQQLGYIVGASYLNYFRWPGLSFALQSPSASPAQITVAMQSFIKSRTAVGLSNDAVFKQHKIALLQNLRQQDANLPARTSRYWHALALNDTHFQRKELLAEKLEQLSFAQWQDFATQLLDYKNASLLLTTADKALSHTADNDITKWGEMLQHIKPWPSTPK